MRSSRTFHGVYVVRTPPVFRINPRVALKFKTPLLRRGRFICTDFSARPTTGLYACIYYPVKNGSAKYTTRRRTGNETIGDGSAIVFFIILYTYCFTINSAYGVRNVIYSFDPVPSGFQSRDFRMSVDESVNNLPDSYRCKTCATRISYCYSVDRVIRHILWHRYRVLLATIFSAEFFFFYY